MAEFIERNALEGSFDAAAMAFLKKEDHLFDRKSVLAGMSIAAGIVHTVPAADVAPVKHGRWIPTDMGSGEPDEAYVCSACGEAWFLVSGNPEENNMNYCPRCGAKIYEEATNED